MSAYKKDPAARSGVIVNFKVHPAVKNAIEEMARQRRGEMGDRSTSGLLVALIYSGIRHCEVLTPARAGSAPSTPPGWGTKARRSRAKTHQG